MARNGATSRDPEGWARATEEARRTRQAVAEEVARNIGAQVGQQIVEGDVMGGRARFAGTVRDIAAAERRGDQDALRAALMGACEALGSWIAGLDYVAPEDQRRTGAAA